MIGFYYQETDYRWDPEDGFREFFSSIAGITESQINVIYQPKY